MFFVIVHRSNFGLEEKHDNPPPPLLSAALPAIVQLVSVGLEESEQVKPPPCTAVFSVIAQLLNAALEEE